MSQQTKKYLLFVLFDIGTNLTVYNDITLKLSTSLNNKKVKSLFMDYGWCGYNFETSIPFDDLKGMVKTIIGNTSYQYFLIDYSDNMFMNPTAPPNFTDIGGTPIDKTTPEPNMRMDFNMDNEEDREKFFSIFNLNDNEDEDDDESDDLIRKIMLKNKLKKNKPTLDYLLDKIYNKGITSLTEKEKQLLNEYARN